jgi:hypothetical protein
MEKIDFEIFKKIWPYHQREMKILTMPWKFEMKKLKFFIFEIEMKISIRNLKKMAVSPEENE